MSRWPARLVPRPSWASSTKGRRTASEAIRWPKSPISRTRCSARTTFGQLALCQGDAPGPSRGLTRALDLPRQDLPWSPSQIARTLGAAYLRLAASTSTPLLEGRGR